MTYAHKKFHAHPVHDELAQLKTALTQFDLQLTNAEQLETLQRTRRIVAHTAARLKACDPDLTAHATLKTIHDFVHHIHDRFREFRDAPAKWQPMDEAAANLAYQLHLLPPLQADGVVPDFASSLEEYRKAVSEAISALNEQRRAMETTIAAVETKASTLETTLAQHAQLLEQQKGRVDSIINEHQQQFSKAQAARQSEYESQRAEWKRAVEEVLADEREQTQRRSKEATKALEETKENWDTALSTKLSATEEAAQALLSDIGDKLAEAKQLVGIIGNVGVTGNYQKIADREAAAANWFRLGALFFLVLAVLGVLWIVVSLGTDGFSWQMAAFRFASVLTFLLPAAYCARESNIHRQNEHRNRRLELELASVAPFLEGLDKPKVDEIRERLAGAYFGTSSQEGHSNEIGTLKSLVPVLRELVKVFRP